MPHVLGVDPAGEIVEVGPGAAGTNPPDVERALDAARAGKIRAISYRIMPLRDAAEAHRIVESNQLAGKLILDPAQE